MSHKQVNSTVSGVQVPFQVKNVSNTKELHFSYSDYDFHINPVDPESDKSPIAEIHYRKSGCKKDRISGLFSKIPNLYHGDVVFTVNPSNKYRFTIKVIDSEYIDISELIQALQEREKAKSRKDILKGLLDIPTGKRGQDD